MQLLSNDWWSLEPGLKLLITIYLGYGVATFYHRVVLRYRPHYQYNYFIITSMILYYWNFGFDIKHPLIVIVIQWQILQMFSGTMLSVILSFLLQFGYYLGGIYVQEVCVNGTYELNWLTPQCVLCLRLIGLSFDYYDGMKLPHLLTPDQKLSALTGCPPSLTEMLAYSFFPGGYLIGPQFPLLRLRKLIRQPKDTNDIHVNERYMEAGKQCLTGTTILAIVQFLSVRYNPLYYPSYEFSELCFKHKVFFVMVTGHLTIMKYLAFWTINDGTCIISGLGFYKCGDEVAWDAVRNANLLKFAKMTRFQHLIVSYNINTNAWLLKYVHKRLKFLNVRILSHFCSMMFLAIWHGFHTGYFTAFTFQLVVINAEKEYIKSASKSPFIKELVEKYPRLPDIVGFFYLHIFLGYCIIDFSLLHWNIYKHVYNSVYWYGHVFFISMYLLSKGYRFFMVPVPCHIEKRYGQPDEKESNSSS